MIDFQEANFFIYIFNISMFKCLSFLFQLKTLKHIMIVKIRVKNN